MVASLNSLSEPCCWGLRAEILYLKDRFQTLGWVISWTPRTCNKAADIAAKFNLDSGIANLISCLLFERAEVMTSS